MARSKPADFERQVIYVAGVLDVLGVFRTRLVGKTELAMVAVHTKNEDLMDYLAQITGTQVTVVTRDYNRFGCDEHCQEKHIHVYNTSLRWSVTGIRAGILIHNVLPHLRLQYDKAAEVLDATAEAPFRKPTAQAMEKLGWKLPEGLLPSSSSRGKEKKQ